jgi:hypothetical protein
MTSAMMRASVVIVDDRLEGNAADASHIGHMRNAVYDGAEYDRCDQHADRLDEGLAKRLHLACKLRIDNAKGKADGHGNEDLNPELLPPSPSALLADRQSRHFARPQLSVRQSKPLPTYV